MLLTTIIPKNNEGSSQVKQTQDPKNSNQNSLHQHIAKNQEATSILTKEIKRFSLSKTENQIPSRFIHLINKEYVDSTQVEHKNYIQEVRNHPGNASLRCQLSYSSLIRAEIARTTAENTRDTSKKEGFLETEGKFLNKAKEENNHAKNIDNFFAPYFYTESIIMEYEGIDCTKIEQVEKYIRVLKTALAIDPTYAEVQQRLDLTIDFLKKKWTVLSDEGKIGKDIVLSWNEQLAKWINENALKVLIINNPSLFNLTKQAKYASFVEKHPELKDVTKFQEIYPEVGMIYIGDKGLEKDNLRIVLAEAIDNPLATKLPLISPRAIVTPVVAEVIKDGMLNFFAKGKTLKVYFGNKDDRDTIVETFKKDKSLGKGTLRSETLDLKDEVYTIFIHEGYSKIKQKA